MYIADGDYIKDIEVNDLRNRYTLTKGSTQKMVNTCLVIPADRNIVRCKSPYSSPSSIFHSLFCMRGQSCLLWKLDSSRTDRLFGRC